MLMLLLAACTGAGDPKPADTADTWPGLDDTSDPGDSGEPGDLTLLSVEEGATCPVDERMGQISLWTDGSGSGVVSDAPLASVGPATIPGEDCTFHLYDANACGGCPSDQLCNGAGECVDQPRTYKDLVLSGTSASASFRWEADAEVGYVYGEHGDAEGPWALTLSFGGLSVELPTLALAPALEGVALTVNVDEDWSYGALDMAWTPSSEGALVHTEIPINHHAQPGTFTVCQAHSSQGSMHATAEQIAPLAVITGLEFQGLSHVHAVAVHTSRGCVEVICGTHSWETPVEE